MKKKLLTAFCLALLGLSPTIVSNAASTETIQQQAPEINFEKTAKWNNPGGDTKLVEFDAKGDIDIDGIVKVNINLDTSNRNSASKINITDYFDSSKWVLLNTSTYSYNVSTGVLIQSGDKLIWNIPDEYTGPATLTYYLQLKEECWDTTTSEYFINTDGDASKKLSNKSCAHLYYIFNNKEYIENSSNPSIDIRQINWIPNVSKLIVNKTDGVYQNKTTKYGNTYYINSSTLLNNINIISNSTIKRDTKDYKLSNNTFYIYSGEDNVKDALLLTSSNNFSTKHTGTDLTGYVDYNFSNLQTNTTINKINQKNKIISIYPAAQTKRGDTVYTTSFDKLALENKRIDLTIDDVNPQIKADEKIRTQSEEGVSWTASDGYVDINLVDKQNNPTMSTRSLLFEVSDLESGIADPNSDLTDWINSQTDNITVELYRVDNDEKLISTGLDDIVKVSYTNGNTALIQVVLDPKNEDILGHLKLKIKALDNVKNESQKEYDLYVFCLTGFVSPSSNVKKEGINEQTVKLENGERGTVNIEAFGYVDNVSVKFEQKLETIYAQEFEQRISWHEPVKMSASYPNYDIVNYTDSSQYSSFDKNGLYILPRNLQTARWGFKEDELGGVDVTAGFNRLNEEYEQEEERKDAIRKQRAEEKERLKQEAIENGEEYVEEEEMDEFDYVKNDILQEVLSELIYNYSNGKTTSVSGDTYYLEGTTLYTYPTFKNGKVNTYAHIYKLSYQNPVTISDKAYPSIITLDGNTYIDVHYEEDGLGVNASVEKYTDITTIDKQIQNTWIQTENGTKRPLVHFFYMPIDAPETTYKIELTASKDSDTDFPHSVSVKLTFSNTANGSQSINDLQTTIEDN